LTVMQTKHMSNIEVTLGNWGTIRCHNLEHRNYLIAAKRRSEIGEAVESWSGDWLTDEQEREYLESEQKALAECNRLWELIPDRGDDLSKSH